MVSPQGREHYQRLCEGRPFGSDGFDLAALRQCMAIRREPADPAVRCIPTRIDQTPCQWVLAPNADPDLRLLYLHGGGYVSGSGDFYLAMAAHISAAAGCAILLPDYRLAPEHPFPAGLEDCIQAHRWLTRNAPDGPASARATFIAGDSAGGGLTLAVMLALRDRGLTPPKGGIAISPFTDLTLSGESIRSQADRDPIMHPDCLPDFVKCYAAEADLRNPLASPLFGDYTGVPALLIQVGEHEIIRDDSVRAAARAQADGAAVTLEVWPGMFHVFASHEPLLPEGRASIDHIAAFMRSCLNA
ncbi:MAG: alpha/beta hydrolase [Phycisphaerae bacterium]|nr:alpha/beta hydrolase [Phycisphaerae bacterium]